MVVVKRLWFITTVGWGGRRGQCGSVLSVRLRRFTVNSEMKGKDSRRREGPSGEGTNSAHRKDEVVEEGRKMVGGGRESDVVYVAQSFDQT